MAWGDASSPARFGAGQTNPASDDRVLFLKVFGGEVLTAFHAGVLTADKHQVQTLPHGKSARFPKVWKATAEYHTAGAEMLGNDIDTSEVEVTVDGKVVAHVAVYDLDQKMSHFDIMRPFSNELGTALALHFDKNVMRAIILAARTAADGPFPAGNVITDASLVNTGTIDGKDWLDAIRTANIDLFNKDVPETMPRYMIVNAAVFDAIKYAKDANGNYFILNRDFQADNAGGPSGRREFVMFDDVKIYKARTLPSTNETGDTSVFTKYRANYSTTTGVLWCPMAVGTLKVEDIAMESERDVRRQEDFMVSKMAVGHGTLRPECAVEFKTS